MDDDEESIDDAPFTFKDPVENLIPNIPEEAFSLARPDTPTQSFRPPIHAASDSEEVIIEQAATPLF